MTEGAEFVDSNVLLYLLSDDKGKANKAEALLRRHPVISVQVLNEVANVCTRKLKMDWPEVGDFLSIVRALCRVVPITVATHDRARALAERHRMSFYDASIVAAATIEGCRLLHSEDMHAGLKIASGDGARKLVIRNPFAPTGAHS